MPLVLLRAFAYLTDLLLIVSTQQHVISVSPSRAHTDEHTLTIPDQNATTPTAAILRTILIRHKLKQTKHLDFQQKIKTFLLSF